MNWKWPSGSWKKASRQAKNGFSEEQPLISNNNSLTDITGSALFERMKQQYFGKRPTETIEYAGYCIVKEKEESGLQVTRLILLAPHGSTHNEDSGDELNPHPETRWAKIEVKGIIKPNKKGFSPTNRIIFRHKEGEISFSWKNEYYVVKENGWGKEHVIENGENEWILLVLTKKFQYRRTPDISDSLSRLPDEEQQILRQVAGKIISEGSALFREDALLESLMRLEPSHAVPTLIELLNADDHGRHEPCTALALLLKFARLDADVVLSEIQKAKAGKTAPDYYLERLEAKITTPSSAPLRPPRAPSS